MSGDYGEIAQLLHSIPAMRQIDLPHRHVDCTVDLDAAGKQHGHIWLPDASSNTAWRRTPVPVCVIQSGSGPTVTCIGGVHGDEFEGPLTLLGLAERLTTNEICGRLILLPALSAAALQQGQRSLSNDWDLDTVFTAEGIQPPENESMDDERTTFASAPIDSTGALEFVAPDLSPASPQKNPDTPPPAHASKTLAHFIESEILPRTDVLVDLRAGGGTLDFTPFAAMYADENAKRREATEACMVAFGAPFSMRWPHLPANNSIGLAAQRTDTVYLQAEMGGGARASRSSLATTRIGVENVLVHLGLSNQEFLLRSSRMVTLLQPDRMLFAPQDGLVELHRDLGADVYRGNPVASMVDPLRTGVTPVQLNSPIDGILLAHHHGGVARAGDCIALIGDEMPR